MDSLDNQNFLSLLWDDNLLQDESDDFLQDESIFIDPIDTGWSENMINPTQDMPLMADGNAMFTYFDPSMPIDISNTLQPPPSPRLSESTPLSNSWASEPSQEGTWSSSNTLYPTYSHSANMTAGLQAEQPPSPFLSPMCSPMLTDHMAISPPSPVDNDLNDNSPESFATKRRRRRSSSVPRGFHSSVVYGDAHLNPTIITSHANPISPFYPTNSTFPRPPSFFPHRQQGPIKIQRLHRRPDVVMDPKLHRKKMEDKLLHANFNDSTVTELKEMLRFYGQCTTGRKNDLIFRLQHERHTRLKSPRQLPM